VELTYMYTGAPACLMGEGKLMAFTAVPGGVYLTNGSRRDVDTKTRIDVPKGVTVKIRGLRDEAARGLVVVPTDIVGPVSDYPVLVLVHNQADATVVLQEGHPIAAIRAVPTETGLRWGARPQTPPPLVVTRRGRVPVPQAAVDPLAGTGAVDPFPMREQTAPVAPPQEIA